MKPPETSETECPEFPGHLVEARPWWRQHRVLGNPARFFDELIGEYGDFVHYRGLVSFYLVNHPALVRQVLRETHRNFDKQTPIYQRFKNAFGDGLVTAEGERWKRTRKLVQPVFNSSAIRSFFDLMVESASSLADDWSTSQASGMPLDLSAVMDELALEIAGRSFFGQAFDDSVDDIRRWTAIINGYVALPPLSLLSNLAIPTPMNLRLRGVMGEYDKFLARMIRERTDEPPRGDLMDILMSASDEETGQGMDGDQLAEEILGMLIGGHETTSKALTWIFFELARHPEIESAMLEEIQTVIGSGTLQLEHLGELKLTRMVIDEAMRLYPPFWFENRNAMTDVELGGVIVPKGSMVVFSRYSLHRHRDFWQAPGEFDPGRFDPDLPNAGAGHAHVPFGGGPRICIGRHFSMMEIQVVMVTLLRRYRIHLVDGGCRGIRSRMTLEPKGGMKVRIEARHGA